MKKIILIDVAINKMVNVPLVKNKDYVSLEMFLGRCLSMITKDPSWIMMGIDLPVTNRETVLLGVLSSEEGKKLFSIHVKNLMNALGVDLRSISTNRKGPPIILCGQAHPIITALLLTIFKCKAFKLITDRKVPETKEVVSGGGFSYVWLTEEKKLPKRIPEEINIFLEGEK